MKERENITIWQFLILMLNFEIGSAVVVGIGTEAKQDAWIACLAATGLGMLLISLYYKLSQLSDRKHLYGIFGLAFGKWAGLALSFLYTVYFIYIAARVTRDFSELINTAILPYTPMEVIIFTLTFLVAYMVYKGIEVTGRTAEVFSPTVFIFIFAIIMMLWASKGIHFNSFRPVLGDGPMPVLRAVFPGLLTFPFGELVTFSMVLPLVSDVKQIKKYSLIGVGISGMLVTLAVAVQIAALGSETRGRASFPLLGTAKNISIGEFVERVDALIVFVMMLGIIVKSGIFLFCALQGIEHLTSRPYRQFVFPVSMIVGMSAVLVSYNYAEHLQEGVEFVTRYVHVPLQIGIPGLALLVLWIKQRKEGGGRAAASKT
ncbi:GerAB/ArcD/ProY family transporter [Ectobacillus ponti]|uniref:Spore germination protein n=1 Tax=Ectobacillus ponti TaxID=2961894 RepID=A0AA41X8T1_9BACI|nr:GerAB/ArcD/ProY family transporter [Ectobacillus ponti]MCP8970822.1 spore germination protein [Ectobacillus ponti]